MRNDQIRGNEEQGSTGEDTGNSSSRAIPLRRYLLLLPVILDEQCPSESERVYRKIWVELKGMLWRPSDHALRPVDGSTTAKDRYWLVKQLYRKLEKYAIAADELVTTLQSGRDIIGEKARNNLDSQEVLIRSIADAAKELSMAEASAISKGCGSLRDRRVRLTRQDKAISAYLEEQEVQNPPTLSSRFTPTSNDPRASNQSSTSHRQKRPCLSPGSKQLPKSKMSRTPAQSDFTSSLNRLVLPKVYKMYRAATDRSIKPKDERDVTARCFHRMTACESRVSDERLSM